LETEDQIAHLKPDFTKMYPLNARGLIVTAKGNVADFVSRCFFPDCGIPEDPVTGSAHCTMVAYWNKKTGKNKFTAIQLSERKGYIDCELNGDRVLMSGNAVLFLKGEIYI
jgi:predicted PhzF superfamily epimerase YddE/YHI9